MTFDSLMLAAIAAELRAAALGRRLGGVVVTSRDSLFLELPRGALFVSTSARDARAHLVDQFPSAASSPPSIQGHFDTLLRGAELLEARTIDFDRVLELSVRLTDRVGRTAVRRVVIEVMGKHSTCCVVDAEGRIEAVLKPVTHQVNRHRELLPQIPYLPPPSGGRTDPLALDRATFCLAWPELCAAPTLQAGWRRQWHGSSDLLWSHLCRHAGLAEATTGDVDDLAQRDALWSAWAAVQQVVANETYQPCVVCDTAGLAETAWPLALPGSEPRETLSQALAETAGLLQERLAVRELRGKLEACLARALKRTNRRLGDLAKRAERAAEAAVWQHQADLLLANLHRVQPRAEVVEVDDWDRPGETLEVPLDPSQNGPQNAQQLYDRARRARHGADGIDAARAELARDLAALQALREEVTGASTSPALQRLAPRVADLTGEADSTQPPGKRPKTERERILRKLGQRESSDGYTILIGRNASESEGLLSRIAAPTDLWLHVRGAGSGHIIVRTEGKPDAVPPRTIEEAARLAARHSKMKHSSLVPVVYTQRKYVTKIRGGAAGKVVYRQEKTLFVEPAGE